MRNLQSRQFCLLSLQRIVYNVYTNIKPINIDLTPRKLFRYTTYAELIVCENTKSMGTYYLLIKSLYINY